MNFFVSTLMHIDIEKTIHNCFWNYSNGYSVKIQGKLYFSDTITLDVRDAYKHLVESVTEVQKSVKQIYDVAILVQMIHLINSQKSE